MLDSTLEDPGTIYEFPEDKSERWPRRVTAVIEKTEFKDIDPNGID
ncbi:MAG TPA: hypothetical protein VE439_00145 [Anaerolineae bacterium]|nr:hypothetical protein [Anaerolineae bacterium]